MVAVCTWPYAAPSSNAHTLSCNVHTPVGGSTACTVFPSDDCPVSVHSVQIARTGQQRKWVLQGGELFEKLTPAQVTSFKHGATDKRKKARALIRDASTEVLRNCQVTLSAL